jgi:predicted RNA-binding Zn-ribbon protein involved in translation (DUF1610 family)
VILFGWRTTVSVLATLVFVCERCGNNAAHHLARRRRWFTLFFVPVIPLGSSHQDTCTACGRVVGVSTEQAERALAAQAPPRAA